MAVDPACTTRRQDKGAATSPTESMSIHANGQAHENGGHGLEVAEKESTLREEVGPERQSGLLGSSVVVGGKEESSTTVRKAVPGEFDLLKVIGMGAFGKVLQVHVAAVVLEAIPQQQLQSPLYHSLSVC